MGTCQLGSLQWRIAPSDISWTYQIDATRIPTLGGQVVQIVGTTFGDVVVTGFFGQPRAKSGPPVQSWQLAEAFQTRIKAMIDAQTLQAPKVTLGPNNPQVIHEPLQFHYHDDLHDWQFQVLIKGLADTGGGQLSHATGKFSYGYQLTLFVVKAQSDEIKNIAIDAFISRLTAGIGWKQSRYNGPMTGDSATQFINGHGGSIPSLEERELLGQTGATATATLGAVGNASSNKANTS